MDFVERAREFVAANPYALAGLIFLASLVVAWIVDQIVTRVLSLWAARTQTSADDRLLGMVHGPVRTTVVLVGLNWATKQLGLADAVQSFTVAILTTIAVFVWFGFARGLLSFVLNAMSQRKGGPLALDPALLPLFDNLSRVILFVLAVYFVFLCWDIDVTAWVASAGIVGIALGFAAKDTLANLFGGIFITADKPYKLGDYINLDSGERGMVTHIGIRTTRLLTRDDLEITIPNAVIANAKIVNETGGRWTRTRIRVQVGVAYGSDVDLVRRVLEEIGHGHPMTDSEPEPRVRFRRFGDSGLEYELLCWIAEPELRGRVLDALNTEVYKAFAREGIEIPYPKRDVYLHRVEDAGSAPID